MALLSISLFGHLEVVLGERLVTGFKSDKVRALLAFLAVEDKRPHSREALAGLLWPDCPNAAALASLRGALANLRRAIGDPQADPHFLCVTRETIQLNTSADYQVDVRAFEASLNPRAWQGETNLPLDPQLAGRLQAATAIYRGHFLDDFRVADSAPFEEWALLKRESLRRQMLDALRYLSALHEQIGDYEKAVQYARQHLALEPWDEDAHQQVMRSLALSGQRSASLAQYEACRRVLGRELKAEPAADTRALYEAIRNGKLTMRALEGGKQKILSEVGSNGVDAARYPSSSTSTSSTTSTAPPASPTSWLCVGRERELAQLDRHLDETLAGQGRGVFVVGDAGSGKTTLLGQFARRALAAHPDLVVAAGRCHGHGDLGDLYQPFREIMRLLAGDDLLPWVHDLIGAENTRRARDLAPDLAQAAVESGADLVDLLIPGQALLARVRAASPNGHPDNTAMLARLEQLVHYGIPPAARANSRQVDLFAQVTAVLVAIARRTPLILVLDDLQWADDASISLLFYLARQLAGNRVLVVGAYRPVTVALGRGGERHSLQPVVHELACAFGDISVDLDQADGWQLMSDIVDAAPNCLGPEFRRELHRRTSGHALYTVELLRGLRERGDLVRDAAGQWTEGVRLDWDHLPHRVEAVIAERIDRLPAAARTLLDVASVEGEEFTAEVAARIMGTREADLIDLLSTTLGRQHRLVSAVGTVRVAGGMLSKYRFRHHLFQTYLYGRLDPVQRVRLHAAVATALEALYAQQVDDISRQLAAHFQAAGLAVRAADYLARAHESGIAFSTG